MESACHSYQMLLSAYADGEVKPQERARIETHLSACVECRGRLEDLKAFSAAFADHLEAQADSVDFSHFADEVFKRIGPEDPGLFERMRIWWAEIMAYHRAAVVSSLATAAVTAAIAVPLVWKLASQNAAQLNPQVVLHQLTLENPNMQPVVMDMGDGKTLIMLVDPSVSSAGESEPLELKTTPPTGGDL